MPIAGTAQRTGQRREPMLEPRHADLVDAAVLEPVGILADDRVVVVTLLPQHIDRSDVARHCADVECMDPADAAVALHVSQITDDDVRPGRWAGVAGAALACDALCRGM